MIASGTRPHILVTNDDGIEARGLSALVATLSEVGDISVIAPDRNRSAISHSITLHAPLRAKSVAERWWSIDGTPTDCVYLAMFGLLDAPIDLVVSGINAGPNLGMDVHYSGTVGAAVEGSIHGISSFAISAMSPRSGYAHAARFAADLARSICAAGGLPKDVTLNVNVPKGEPTEYRFARLGRRPYAHSVERRDDPRGQPYYWIGGIPERHEEEPDTDCALAASGLIAVTPMRLDVTELGVLEEGIERYQPDGWTLK